MLIGLKIKNDSFDMTLLARILSPKCHFNPIIKRQKDTDTISSHSYKRKPDELTSIIYNIKL